MFFLLMSLISGIAFGEDGMFDPESEINHSRSEPYHVTEAGRTFENTVRSNCTPEEGLLSSCYFTVDKVREKNIRYTLSVQANCDPVTERCENVSTIKGVLERDHPAARWALRNECLAKGNGLCLTRINYAATVDQSHNIPYLMLAVVDYERRQVFYELWLFNRTRQVLYRAEGIYIMT